MSGSPGFGVSDDFSTCVFTGLDIGEMESSAHFFSDLKSSSVNWWPDDWVWLKDSVTNIYWDWSNVVYIWFIWEVEVS
jgi:hypothetical protein